MKYRIDIVIDLDDIQQAIYTEGTWHPADNATAWGVNPSNEPIVDRRVREGLDDLLARMSGYIVSQNINFNLEHQNIVLGLELKKRPLLSLAPRPRPTAPVPPLIQQTTQRHPRP